MAESDSNKKGGKPVTERTFDIWWQGVQIFFDRYNRVKKESLDCWAAVPQAIIQATLAADFDISRAELWDRFFTGILAPIIQYKWSIFKREEVPPPRNLDRRLVFSGSVQLINLRGLWAMAEQGILSPEDQLRHVKDCGSRLDQHGREVLGGRIFVHLTRLILEESERVRPHDREGIRDNGEPEKNDTENKSPSGPEDGLQSPDEKEQLKWPKPTPRDKPAPALALNTNGRPAPPRGRQKPRWTHENIRKWLQAENRRAEAEDEAELKAQAGKAVVNYQKEASKHHELPASQGQSKTLMQPEPAAGRGQPQAVINPIFARLETASQSLLDLALAKIAENPLFASQVIRGITALHDDIRAVASQDHPTSAVNPILARLKAASQSLLDLVVANAAKSPRFVCDVIQGIAALQDEIQAAAL
ncbi:hypothetical protein DL765_001144 [Monosporascus sp. GIB2]|nr:hypothetical protein DL765_001144 [Monosporascus sp. GIB2]